MNICKNCGHRLKKRNKAESYLHWHDWRGTSIMCHSPCFCTKPEPKEKNDIREDWNKFLDSFTKGRFL